MASVKKFSAGAVRNQLRHNEREIAKFGAAGYCCEYSETRDAEKWGMDA